MRATLAAVVALIIAAPAVAAPHVAGTWRVTYTPLNFNDNPLTLTWRVLPYCEFGGCSFLARSSAGSHLRFVIDVYGRWRWRRDAGPRPTADCVQDHTGRVLARRSYFMRFQTTLRATRIDRDGNATRLQGLRYTYYQASGRALARGCRARDMDIERVYAVRLGP